MEVALPSRPETLLNLIAQAGCECGSVEGGRNSNLLQDAGSLLFVAVYQNAHDPIKMSCRHRPGDAWVKNFVNELCQQDGIGRVTQFQVAAFAEQAVCFCEGIFRWISDQDGDDPFLESLRFLSQPKVVWSPTRLAEKHEHSAGCLQALVFQRMHIIAE